MVKLMWKSPNVIDGENQRKRVATRNTPEDDGRRGCKSPVETTTRQRSRILRKTSEAHHESQAP
jgi:hypothetical protein